MYYPYDWSTFFKQYPKEFIRNKCENRAQSECEPNCDYYDSHKQSPIQVQFDPNAPKCDDRHSFHHPIDGTCNDGEISFKVTPTGLRADLNCTERPNLDLSRNADFWEMRAIELKVPAEHEQKLENGTVLTYDAEIQMVHTGTGLHEHEFNIVSVWIKAVSGATKSAELEKYLLKWEDAQEKQYARCDKRFIESKCSIENGYVPSTSSYYEWETITLDTFEPFTELHYIGGAQTLISRFEGFTSSGVKAMRIRSDGDSARFWHKIDYDVRKFNSLEVRFFVYAKKVRNQDAFLLEYSADGGKSFNEIKTWVVPQDIQIDGAGNWNSTQTVFITRNDYKEAFSKHFRLAFRSKTSSTSRQFYIDDIEFLGNQAPLESLEETTSMDLIDNTMMNLCTSNTLETCCTGHIVPYWSLITNDEFENGWGNFKGTDTTNAMLSGYTGCENGSKCVRLRDASSNSTAALFSHYQSHDVTSFTELKVQFHFRTAGLDKGQTDGFALDYSDNNGVDDSWVEIQEWSMIDNSIVNDQSIRQVITISRNEVNFSSSARLRFRAIDTSPSDNVYIDSISFSGLYDPSNFCKDITDLCCKRQLQENNSLLRGSVKESEATPSSSSSRIDNFREKTPRYLTSSTEDSGYLCVDAEDFFCPYALFRETKNPVSTIINALKGIHHDSFGLKSHLLF